MSMNKCHLHGFVGKDPELKVVADGNSLARFSIATTENWKNKAGEKQSKTEWHNIVAWGKQAETIEKLVRKGQELIIEGKIEYTQNKDTKVWYTNIRLISFDFCGKKGEGSSQRDTPDPEFSGPDYGGGSDGGSDETSNASSTVDDSEIPF